MTIKLLAPYPWQTANGAYEIPAGAVVNVFTSATEAGLIAANLAVASAAAITWTPPSETGNAGASLTTPEVGAVRALVSGYGLPYRERPLRFAYAGDSTGNCFAISTAGAVTDSRIITEAFPASGTTSISINGDKTLLSALYPSAWMVACGGISGEKTDTMLARDGLGASATRRAISDMGDLAVEVAILRAGINDVTTYVNAGSAASVVTDIITRRTKLKRRMRARGMVVIDEGIAGYSPSSGTAADIAARRAAILQINAAAKAECDASLGTQIWIEPIGLTCDATAAFLPGYTDAGSGGVHLTLSAQYAVAQAEATVLTQRFGPSLPMRYPGVNLLGANALIREDNVTTPGYGNLAAGFGTTISNCTRQNADVIYRDGKVWQVCEFTLTGSSATAQMLMPYTPVSLSIAANDVLGCEFDYFIEGVSSSLPPTPTAMNAQLQTNDGVGIISINVMALSYPNAWVGSGIQGKAVLPPWKCPKAAASLSNTNSSLRWILQTNQNDGSTFRMGVSAPSLVKLNADGSVVY